MDASKEWLTLHETALLLGVSKVTVRRWTQRGVLPCTRIGTRGDRRFRKADVQILLAATEPRRGGREPDDEPERLQPPRIPVRVPRLAELRQHDIHHEQPEPA